MGPQTFLHKFSMNFQAQFRLLLLVMVICGIVKYYFAHNVF
jgi:hypothetical protein